MQLTVLKNQKHKLIQKLDNKTDYFSRMETTCLSYVFILIG